MVLLCTLDTFSGRSGHTDWRSCRSSSSSSIAAKASPSSNHDVATKAAPSNHHDVATKADPSSNHDVANDADNRSAAWCLSPLRNRSHHSNRTEGRIALEISGILRSAELTAELLEALVIADAAAMTDVFWHVAYFNDSALDRRSLERIRRMNGTRAVVAEPVEDISKDRLFDAQWGRVAGAHWLARRHEREHAGVWYRAMVRLRTDAVFVRRFDFGRLAADFQARAGRHHEWLALPTSSPPHSCRRCTSRAEVLDGTFSLTDQIAVGTPAAFDAYSSYTPALLDGLVSHGREFHGGRELYTSLAMQRLFYFNGSAASGGAPYGGGVSGDDAHGFAGPCVAPRAALATYPPRLHEYFDSRSRPPICDDPTAPQLFHFNACGIGFARYDGDDFRSGQTPAWYQRVLDHPEVAGCPSAVSRVSATHCHVAGGTAPVPCHGLCLNLPRLPPVPQARAALLRSPAAMLHEFQIRLGIDQKFGAPLVHSKFH